MAMLPPLHPEGGGKALAKVGIPPHYYTASQPRRPRVASYLFATPFSIMYLVRYKNEQKPGGPSVICAPHISINSLCTPSGT